MSIIYSYPTTQPTLDDLLIGTDVGDDNATKSFSVQSLVSLINASQNNGIITDVTISTSDIFIIANKTSVIGDPAIAYTLGLTATGTPSSTTFLRGDNQWVTPTVTSGISVLGQSASPPITTDLSQLNFTGAGVVTSSSGSGGVQVNIAGLTNVVETIVAGNGIGISGPTGNVIISNTGITGLTPGNGISISTTTAGVSTVSVTGQTTGTVTSVAPGPGLSLISGTTTVNPVIGLDYTGADTYITEPAVAVPLAADLIPFHSIAGDTVNKVTFGDIQASTLTLLNTALTTSDADNVKNNTDTYTTVPITANVITLLDSEYNTLVSNGTTVANTLYLTTSTAPTTGTVQFTIVDTGISAGSGCGFSTPVTTCNPAFTDGTNLTNVAIGTTYTLTTVVTASGANCTFSNGSSTSTQVLTGTVTSGTTQVTQSLTGSISAPAAPGTVTDTLNAITTGISGSQYTTNAPRQLSGTQGNSFNTIDFGYTATANAGYVFSPGGASVNGLYDQATSYYGDNNTTGYFNATTLTAVTYPVTYTLTDSITDNSGNGYTFVYQDSFNGLPPGSTIQVASGGSATATVRAIPVNGTPVSGFTATGTVTNVTSAQSIPLTITGTIASNTGTASMAVDTSGLTGPSAGYTITYTANGATYTPGSAISGAVGSNVNFVATISLNSPAYTATSPLTVVYSNGTGTVNIPGSVTATISGTVAVTSTRTSFSRSSKYNNATDACNLGGRGYSSYLQKGSGNTSSYAEQGDTVYTGAYGSSVLNNGFYATTINTGTSNAYIQVVSGSITLADPCL